LLLVLFCVEFGLWGFVGGWGCSGVLEGGGGGGGGGGQEFYAWWGLKSVSKIYRGR